MHRSIWAIFMATAVSMLIHPDFLYARASKVIIAFNKTVDDSLFTYRYVITEQLPIYWVDFNTAEQECVAWGGHLTSIHSENELKFLQGLIATKSVQNVFVGFDISKWTDGTRLDHISWKSRSGQQFAYRQNSSDRSKRRAFICRKKNDEDDDDMIHDGCRPHEKIINTKTIEPPYKDYILRRVSIRCNRPETIFEVRYNDSSFCVCGKLLSASHREFECRKHFSGKAVKLEVSFEKQETLKDMCNFTLKFARNSSRRILFPIPVKMVLGKVGSSVTKTLATTSTSSSVSTTVHSTPSSPVPSSVVDRPVIQTSEVIRASPTTVSLPLSTTLSPLTDEEKIYQEDLNYINEVDTSSVNIDDMKTIGRVLDAATTLIGSNKTIGDGEEDPGMKAVKILENLGKTISTQLDLGNHSQVSFQQATENVVFGVAVLNTTTSTAFTFPSGETKTIGDEKINIPKSVFTSSSGKAFFVGIIFNGVSEMKNKTGGGDFVMGSRVINAKISPPPADTLEEPVEMTFEKIMNRPSFQQDCSFWIDNNTLSGEHGRWSTRQCEQVFQNETHIKCACEHFTNFAVLFKVTNDQVTSEEDVFRLEIITYVGLGLSILGCFLTFVIYVTLQNIKSDRATIHTNLVLALGIADIIFLLTVAIKPVKDDCLTFAMLAFYFYLAVFFWMFVEGVYIYLMVIKVFRGNVTRRRRIAYVVGWGCPVIITVVTWAILRDDVVSKYHCWLSVDSGAIWAFVGPALFIILVNMVILMAVMRTTWATFVDEKEYGGLKSAVKTFGAVIPLLGITWIFGLMAFNETALVFQYIFAITNSIQGVVIFILYCLVNGEVRREIQRKIAIWKTRRDVSSSSGRRISSEKNTIYNRSGQSMQTTPDLARHPLYKTKNGAPLQNATNGSFENVVYPDFVLKNTGAKSGVEEVNKIKGSEAQDIGYV